MLHSRGLLHQCCNSRSSISEFIVRRAAGPLGLCGAVPRHHATTAERAIAEHQKLHPMIHQSTARSRKVMAKLKASLEEKNDR